MMEDVECGVSLKAFEHITCSVDGQERGNLDMWSVAREKGMYMYMRVAGHMAMAYHI